MDTHSKDNEIRQRKYPVVGGHGGLSDRVHKY